MKAILFYIETDTQLENNRIWIDQWCSMVGFTHIMIDKTKQMRKTNKNVFWSIQEAVAAYPDHEFVFMEQMADTKHTDFVHPTDNVIYCVGSDDDGFQGYNTSRHMTLTLSNKRSKEESSYYAATIIPMLLADIFLRQT